MHIANDPDPTPTPDYLWRVLREYICVAWNMLGAPIEIARRVWVTRAEARAMWEVLRPLEMMLRRLVFLDALECAAPAPIPVRTAPRVRVRRDAYNLESSTTWHASFDLGLDRRRLAGIVGARGQMPARAPAVQTNTAHLPNAELTRNIALRYEALLRGFNDPAPLVKRMVRLLARDRARQHILLADVRKADRAKPFFAQAALTIQLAREKFQSWLSQQLDLPPSDSS